MKKEGKIFRFPKEKKMFWVYCDDFFPKVCLIFNFLVGGDWDNFLRSQLAMRFSGEEV